MSDTKIDMIPTGGSSLDKAAKIILVLFACLSSVLILGLVVWKSRQRSATDQPPAQSVTPADIERTRRVATLAERLGLRSHLMVIFSHGSMVAIPWDTENPLETAKSVMKNAPDEATIVEIKESETGDLLYTMSGNFRAIVFREEVVQFGREHMGKVIEQNMRLDRDTLVPVKIVMPKPTR